MEKLIFDHCRFSVYGSSKDEAGGSFIRVWVGGNSVPVGEDGVVRLIRVLLTWLVGEDTISDQLIKDIRKMEVGRDKNT